MNATAVFEDDPPPLPGASWAGESVSTGRRARGGSSAPIGPPRPSGLVTSQPPIAFHDPPPPLLLQAPFFFFFLFDPVPKRPTKALFLLSVCTGGGARREGGRVMGEGGVSVSQVTISSAH